MSFNPPPLPPVQPPWPQFQVWWQQVLGSLKETLSSQQTAIDALAAAVAAQTAADAAQATANAAQSTASTVTINDKITASWTVPADLVDAADTGSNVTITVAAHTRLYGDGSQVSVAGHTFTGKAYSTDYGIYYDDLITVHAGTYNPTYQITTNLTRAQNNYVQGRHRIGIVTTPSAGAPATTGGSSPPGGGSDPTDRYSTL